VSPELEIRLARLREPGAWFWIALAAGAAWRIYLIVCTEGSFDVAIKQFHASQIHELGLLEYYRRGTAMNHPPLAGCFFEAAHLAALASGIPFRVWLRLPFALLDAGAAGLLFALLRGSPWRRAVVAGYWLSPLAWLFSSYHGNTDFAVACAALLALAAAARGRPALAGAVLGLGAGVKLPAALAAPGLFFAFADWRRRFAFAATATLFGVISYMPLLALEPELLYRRVFGYPGSGAQTVHGVAIWGLAGALGLEGTGAARFLAAHNTPLVIVPIVAVAWLRRGRDDARELGATLFGSFMLLYGLSSQWAFQYLAWSAPFWAFRGAAYALAGSLLLGGYVYAVYAFYCESPWLLGLWDHVGHPLWPAWLRGLRDASVLFCFASALFILWTALRSALGARRA
jgi:hypothetical protein